MSTDLGQLASSSIARRRLARGGLVALVALAACSCRLAPHADPGTTSTHSTPVSQATAGPRQTMRSSSSRAELAEGRQPRPDESTIGASQREVIPCAATAPCPAPPPVGCPAGSCASCGPGRKILGAPLPAHGEGGWSPPGLAHPWPDDEYLCDGGDRGAPVIVEADWTLHNLGTEDTIAHFDTIDGRTLVESSNRVCIYAPRFGAVRTVTRLGASDQAEPVAGVATPERLAHADESLPVASSLQREQVRRQTLALPPGEFGTKLSDGALSTSLLPREFVDAYLPFENLAVVRLGVYEQTEKARLAEGVQAAIAWTETLSVQVSINRQSAQALAGDRRAQATFVVDTPNSPRLRLVKLASTCAAQPGETVDFTLRFDNVGDQAIGNVVLVDNLSTRLEYVPDSSQASVAASFSSERNESHSLVLRWELPDPLPSGAGGIIRFRCKVR